MHNLCDMYVRCVYVSDVYVIFVRAPIYVHVVRVRCCVRCVCECDVCKMLDGAMFVRAMIVCVMCKCDLFVMCLCAR